MDMEVPDYPVPPPPASARGAIAKASTPRSPRSSLASSSRPKSSRSFAGAGAGGGAWGRGAVFASGGSDSQIQLWRANFDRCAPAGPRGELCTHVEAAAGPSGARQDEKAVSKTTNEATEASARPPPASLASQPLALSPLKGLENESSFKSRTQCSTVRTHLPLCIHILERVLLYTRSILM